MKKLFALLGPLLTACATSPPDNEGASNLTLQTMGGASPASCFATTSETYESCVTASKPELISVLPVDNVKRVVMSLPINDILKNDILLIHGEWEVSNNSTQWASFCRSAILAASPTSTTGQALTEQQCENFNPAPSSCWIGRCDVHHLIGSRTSFVLANANITAAYINFLAWSNTDPAQPSNVLTIEVGYGRAESLRIRP